MSRACCRLCVKILEGHYGNVVAQVGGVLLERGEQSVPGISKYIEEIPKQKIHESLAVLIQFNLVTFRSGKKTEVLYGISHEQVLLMLRYVRYQLLIGDLYDRQSEMIIDALLHEGQAPASTIIINSALLVKDANTLCRDPAELHILMKDRFALLVKGHFIQRCPSHDDKTNKVPKLAIEENELYYFPQDKLNLKALQNRITSPNYAENDAGNEDIRYGDEKILWKVHFDQFHLEMRDNEVKNAIARRIDPLAAECVRALLKQCYITSDPWAPILNPVPVARVKSNLKDMKHIEQYLRILEEDSGNLVSRVGDEAAGEYRLHMCAMYETITRSIVDDIVKHRHGWQAARIFRIVREHQMLEPDSISRLAMLSTKDANVFAFQLFRDQLLEVHEIRRSAIPSPANKNIYLYHVNMRRVIELQLERCYKGVYNVMIHRSHVYNSNRKLLDKKARVDAIVGSLQSSGASQEQIQEVEEMLSEREQKNVKQALMFQDKLLEKGYSIDETIFIFKMYLYYIDHTKK